jgi:hypothetical protein
VLYDGEMVKKAFLLYQEVMTKGELKRKDNPDTYGYYFDLDIRDILERIFLHSSESKIFYVEDTLYFVPDLENETFSYSNEELRNLMGLNNNRELYLAQFIWMNLISEFYGDQFQQTNRTLSFIKVDEMIKKVKEYMDKFEEKSEEELTILSHEYQLDLAGLIDAWNNLEELTQKDKNVKRYKNKRYSFFLRVLGFWEKEGLLQIKEEQEITLTKKIQSIIGSYYHNEERINKIKELLNFTMVKEMSL